jgi:hypothetical protein
MTCGVFGPPTQFPAEVHVADSLRTEGFGKRLAVELGIESAVRRGADIGYRGHVVLPQQHNERLERVRGMTDGEYGATGVFHGCYLRSAVMIAAISL